MVYINLLLQQLLQLFCLRTIFLFNVAEDYKIPRCQLLDYKEEISNRI